MKRTIKRIAFAVVGLLVMGLLGFVAINSRGVELNPQAAALIQRFHDHPDPPGNAFYPLIGLQLPGKAHPETKGRKFAARISSMGLRPRSVYAVTTFQRLMTLKDVPDCSPPRDDCLAIYQANRTRIRAGLRKYRGLLDGYSSTVRDYQVFFDPGDLLAWDVGLLSAHQLYVLKTLDLWGAGHRQRALRKLSREVSFWRMMLRDARLSPTRFMAVTILFDDFGLAGQLLGTCAECREMVEASELFTPLTQRELDSTKAREGDFAQGALLMRKAAKERRKTASFWQRLFYHPNRITNALYDELQDELRLANAPPERRTRLANKLNAKYAIGSSLISWVGLYVHPQSKMLAAISWAARGDSHADPARKLEQYRAQIAKRLRLER